MPVPGSVPVSVSEPAPALTPVPESVHQAAQEARQARFGTLPDRVAFEDMVQETPALPANQAVDSYDPDGVGVRFSCLAADWGL